MTRAPEPDGQTDGATEAAAPPVGVGADGPDLEKVAGKGSAWLALINLFSRGAQMGMTIVLAAIFTQQEMGLVALVLAVLNIGQVIMSMGVYDLIAHAPDPRAAAGTVATMSVGVATVFAALCVGGAPVLAQILGAPDAVNLIRAAFLSLPFTAYAGVQLAFLHRGLDFRRRLIPDAGSAITGAVVTIVLALAGVGVMSTAIGVVTTAVLAPLLGLLIGVRVPFVFDKDLARQALRWAGLVGPAAVLGLAVQNADYLVITRMLDTAATGVYSVAYRIAFVPFLIIGIVLGSVAIPVYTQLQRDNAHSRIPEMIGRFLGLTGASVIGLCVVVAAMADHVDLLGTRWSGAAWPMRVLCLYTIGMSLLTTLASALRACGRPGRFLWSQIAHFVILIPLLVAGTHAFGILGTAAGQVGAVALALLLVAVWVRAFGAGFRLLLSSLRGPLVAALVVLVAAVAVGWAVPHTGPDLVAALWQGVLYCMVYLGVLSLVDRELAAYLVASIPGVKGRAPQPGTRARHRKEGDQDARPLAMGGARSARSARPRHRRR